MLKFYKLMFFNTMMFGTLIAISSYSWLSMWIGLEINLLSIIPLLKSKFNLFPSEAALKYFITQALASSILLLSIILMFNLKIWGTSTFMMILNSALLTKLGAAPFHAWFPEVIEGLNWNNSMIMLIWQKIAPMILLFYFNNLTLFFTIIIIISSMVSGILGLNQISLRKILAYSSINHISWMLSSMLNTQLIWFFYFIVYSIITLNIALIFKKLNIFYLNQLSISLNWNKMVKYSFYLNFLSLGGLPPFLGFLPKWLVVNNLILNNFYLLSIILIILTLITLFFYLRIMFSMMMINFNEPIIFTQKSLNYLVLIFNSFSIFGLLACTLIFNFI
uniref:NADH-ubiquinone oxidoreductase chain 2 n=1 Tax=Lamiinae sp. 2 ACP-2013 TaxID=1434532 RepID=A0A3G5FNE6_9CUCU|nr:NADH dehydrogenase subunit 2 [Lamiinae sp. 2 ACP-2013]